MGHLLRLDPFLSQAVPPRTVDIWLPAAYERDSQARFPVLYMQDGQNLFDSELANTGVDWGVDEAIERLAARGAITPAIVVGVWCLPNRWAEYMPQKALRYAPAALGERFVREQGPLSADAYLDFLIQELKPWIDGRLRTRPEQEATQIAGSSMGGLLSLYAVCEYPDIFGAAGCLSTHWPAMDGAALTYLEHHLPAPSRGTRVYFDHGSEGLDEAYAPFQDRASALMTAAGYTRGENWATHVFPGAGHNETAWRARLETPLQFLLRRG